MIPFLTRKNKVNRLRAMQLTQKDLFAPEYALESEALTINMEVEADSSHGSRTLVVWSETPGDRHSEALQEEACKLERQLRRAGESTQVKAVSIYPLSAELEKRLLKDDLHLLNGNQIILQYPKAYSPSLSRFIFLTTAYQLQPIITFSDEFVHNFHFSRDKDVVRRLIGRKCLFQIKQQYLTGLYGAHAERLAHLLLESGRVTLIGAHCNDMPPRVNRTQAVADLAEVF